MTTQWTDDELRRAGVPAPYVGDDLEECQTLHDVLVYVLESDPEDVDVMLHLAVLRIRELITT